MKTQRDRMLEMTAMNWAQAQDWIEVIIGQLEDTPMPEFDAVRRLCLALHGATEPLSQPQFNELRGLQRLLAPNPTRETRIGIVGSDVEPEAFVDSVIGNETGPDVSAFRRACLAYIYFSFLLESLQQKRIAQRTAAPGLN